MFQKTDEEKKNQSRDENKTYVSRDKRFDNVEWI